MILRFFKFSASVIAFITLLLAVVYIRSLKTAASHPMNFFDEQSFYKSISEADYRDGEFTKKVRGGVIPHHLFASNLMADFYSKLSKQEPETIILIGPNHKEAGNTKVITSNLGWETPFGAVESDVMFVNKLISNEVGIDDWVIEEDHAVAGSMPFIKYYLPKAKVVPLLLSAHMSLSEIDMLVGKLSEYTTGNTVLVSAVDFSHYLISEKAVLNDIKTLEMMQNRDYKTLSLANSDYLDSPPSIILLLKVLDKKNKGELEVIENTNSGKMQKNETVETTSYFEIAIY